MIESVCKKPFNFTLPEKYTVSEDTTYPLNNIDTRIKVYKLAKLGALESMEEFQKDVKDLPPARQKKFNDSLEVVVRKKMEKGFRRYIQKHLQWPGGIQQLISEKYCNAIACCYDPHSEYMSLTTREHFEAQLGKKNLTFGFSLDEDDDGSVVIDELKPGSPAFQSGQINTGDKILSVQWGGSKAIDVSGASMREIADILQESNHEKAILTVKKADGSTRQVTLHKEEEKDDVDEDKVKSFILKGQKSIGYISLPSFYEDWENKININGCANDVAKEIIKLKKENIEGLIIDIRYNGGGSLKEAVELAGIFIDAGPVAIEKTREGKPYTFKDVNRGTVYDGPLLLMVNGYSASASELFAGCLQDYNRALVVGTPTYGKATGQLILPLDTSININGDLSNYKTSSFIKLTMMQLFRVSGNTAQFNGVIPDITFPDLTEIQRNKEKDNPFAIPAVKIEGNKYYLPGKQLSISSLKQKATSILNDPWFVKEQTYIDSERADNFQKHDISLKLSDHISSGLQKINKEEEKSNSIFTIQNNSYELQRIQGNADLKEMNDSWINSLGKDAYLKAAYQLIQLL